MNFYQGVVLEYLRADRSIFVNEECCIQLNAGSNPDQNGPHWYCDALACDFKNHTVFLCEITYSSSLAALVKRLKDWNDHWDMLREALVRDSSVPKDWIVRPWIFVPEHLISLLLRRLDQLGGLAGLKFKPRLTTLEMVQPWRYRSWDRQGEDAKPEAIPPEMQS